MSPLDSTPDSVFVSIRLIRKISNTKLKFAQSRWAGHVRGISGK